MRSVEPMTIGARNPRLRRLRRLVARSKARSEERAFVVDGPQLVADALRSGLVVEEIFAAPDVLVDIGLDGLIGPEVDVYEVEARVLVSVLDPVNPRPVAAVVVQPSWSLDDLAADRPVLVAVELRDPGNLGTAIRSAEAAGLAGVAVVGSSVDRFAPKVVRASAGSLFRIPIVAWSDAGQALAELSSTGRPVLAAVVDPAAAPYDEIDLSAAAILVGNEPHGLAPELVARADAAFTIPVASRPPSCASRRPANGAGRAGSRPENRWTPTGPVVNVDRRRPATRHDTRPGHDRRSTARNPERKRR